MVNAASFDLQDSDSSSGAPRKLPAQAGSADTRDFPRALQGDYLVEARLARPAGAETCRRALAAMGWADAIVDESPRKAESTILRFVGRTGPSPILIRDTPALSWAFVHELGIDPMLDLRRGDFLAYKLFTGETYEVRLLSRLGLRDKERLARDVVEQALVGMGPEGRGFVVHHLSAIRHKMRLPDRPGADHDLWIAILRWDGPNSVVTGQDPIFFEELSVIPELQAPSLKLQAQNLNGSP